VAAWSPTPSRGSPAEAALVSEGEAFLLGSLVDLIESRAGNVPVWAWTNLLAHGTEEDLQGAAATVLAGGVAEHTQWHQARSYLAAEVLHCAQLHGSLAELQRAVLVPLELGLTSRPEVAGWGPGRWATTVEMELTNLGHPLLPKET
jgi:hypothetical protein